MAVDMAVDLAKAMAVHSIKSLLHYANYIKIRHLEIKWLFKRGIVQNKKRKKQTLINFELKKIKLISSQQGHNNKKYLNKVN